LREGLQHWTIAPYTGPKSSGHEVTRRNPGVPVPGHPGLRLPSAFARMASRAVAQSASRGRMCHRSRRDDRRWVEAPSCAFVPAHRAASRAFAAVLSKDVPCRQSQGETSIAPHRHASKGGFHHSRSTLSEGLLATRGFPQIREEPFLKSEQPTHRGRLSVVSWSAKDMEKPVQQGCRG